MSVCRSITSFWTTRLNLSSYFSNQPASVIEENDDDDDNDLIELPQEHSPGSIYSPRELAFRKRIRGAIISHVWDAASMFVGTIAWMGVYYAQPWFEEIDDDGYFSYFLHCLAMGVVSNAAVIPFDYFSQVSKGEAGWKALAAIKKYFILYTIPDVLYEPVADFLIAISKPDGFENFDFVKYDDSTFTVREIIGAFFLFGVAFGLIYYGGEKAIHHFYPADEKFEEDDEELTLQDDSFNRVMRVIRDFLESSEVYSIKAAIQYFIFYLTDFIFDVDWIELDATGPQLLGVSGLMAAYSLFVDCFPEILHLIERSIYPPQGSVQMEVGIESSINRRRMERSDDSFDRVRSVYQSRHSSIEISNSRILENANSRRAPGLFEAQNGVHPQTNGIAKADTQPSPSHLVYGT